MLVYNAGWGCIEVIRAVLSGSHKTLLYLILVIPTNITTTAILLVQFSEPYFRTGLKQADDIQKRSTLLPVSVVIRPQKTLVIVH